MSPYYPIPASLELKQKAELPKEFREKWLSALRSGEFKQGQHTLCTQGPNTKYCCLGVAGKVLGMPDERLYSFAYLNSELGKHTSFSIPIAIDQGREPSVLGSQEKMYLISILSCLNDGICIERPATFLEIADYIERNTVGV